MPGSSLGVSEAVAYATKLQQGKDAAKAAQEAKRTAKVGWGGDLVNGVLLCFLFLTN